MTKPHDQSLPPAVEAAIQKRFSWELQDAVREVATLAAAEAQQAERGALVTAVVVTCHCGAEMVPIMATNREALYACETCAPGQVNVQWALPPAPDGSQEDK